VPRTRSTSQNPIILALQANTKRQSADPADIPTMGLLPRSSAALQPPNTTLKHKESLVGWPVASAAGDAMIKAQTKPRSWGVDDVASPGERDVRLVSDDVARMCPKGRPVRVALAVCCISMLLVTCASCSQATFKLDTTQPVEFWVLVLDNDRFLAYKTTETVPIDVLLSPPHADCSWQPIQRAKQFVKDNLWLPGLLQIVPTNENEPYLSSINELLHEDGKVAWSTTPISLSNMAESDEVNAFRRRLETLRPIENSGCYCACARSTN